jgi:Flp pilus assembly protein TadG
MRSTLSQPARRRGATTVETAVVISIALLFIFGILEYARLLYFLHVADNAAREGARYAVVHTGDGTIAGTATDTPVFDGTGRFLSPTTTVAAVVNYSMGTAKANLTGYTVTVYNADPVTGAVAAGKWTDAPFGGAVGVQVSGTYRFILPSFLGFAAPTMSMQIKSTMTSEAN